MEKIGEGCLLMAALSSDPRKLDSAFSINPIYRSI